MNLAELIGAAPTGPRLRQATVVGTPAGGVATLRFADQTAPSSVTTNNVLAETGSSAADDIAGVRSLVAVANGDTVWVLQAGGALLIVGAVDTGWKTATLINSWTVYGDGNYGTAAMYRKVGGIVYLRGLLNSVAATNGVAFYLPAGYRPSTVTRLLIGFADNGANRFDVGTGGDVSGPIGRGWVSFSDIHFPADQ